MSVDQYISSGVLELYALHALPPDEMRKVEDMVEQYPRLKDELEAIKQGLIKYAESYAPEPSQGLYDKILNRINDLPQREETVKHEAVPVIALKQEKPEDQKKEQPFQVSDTKVKSINGRYLAMVAASIILLLISIGVNYYQYNQYNDIKGQLVAMQQEKDAVANKNSVLQTKFEQTASKLELYTDPHNEMVMMKGLPISPASEVMVVWNTKNKDVYVDVHLLPTPPEGMQYQLWAIDKSGKPVDAGLLTPYKERKEKGPEQMQKKVMEAVAFAITLEPKGGSVNPTADRMYVKGGV